MGPLFLPSGWSLQNLPSFMLYCQLAYHYDGMSILYLKMAVYNYIFEDCHFLIIYTNHKTLTTASKNKLIPHISIKIQYIGIWVCKIWHTNENYEKKERDCFIFKFDIWTL